MKYVFLFLGFFSFYLVKADDNYVTCGSVIKLLNLQEGVRLHSHDVKYGSGSGQQSITGMPEADDANSHWQVMAPMKKYCHRGVPVKCGDKIRLKHLTTGCYLHSHLFNAPLSRGNQEVSCFGREEKGDTGDHWILLCDTSEWLRGEPIRLKHSDTGKYLATSGHQYGRPISGQREVVGVSSSGKAALWKTAEGVYMIHSNDDIYREVLPRDVAKESCFEDADDKTTICQVETATEKSKKSSKSTPKKHYSNPQKENDEESFVEINWKWFCDMKHISDLVWWLWKYIFCSLIVYLLFPDLRSVFVPFLVLAILLLSFFWFKGYWSF